MNSPAFRFVSLKISPLDEALAMYPYLRPSGHDDRLPPMDKRAFDRILENAANVETNNWKRMGAYAPA